MRTSLGALVATGLLAACTSAADPAPPDPSTVVFTLPEHWPEPASGPGVGAGRVIITNDFEDTVSLFDVATLGDPAQAELARVPVGRLPVELEGPHHAAIDPAGAYFWVGLSYAVPSGSGPHGARGDGTAPGWLAKYRAADARLVATVELDPNPGDLTISPDGATLYLTHFDLLRIQTAIRTGQPPSAQDSRLAVVDAATMTVRALIPLCPAAHGVATSPDGRWVYAACYSDELALVDTTAPDPVARRLKVAPDAAGVTDAIYTPYALTVAPNGEVWVSGTKDRKLLVYDPTRQEMDDARTVALDGAPMLGTFSRDGARLYVAHQSPDGVAIIDPATSTVLRDVRLPPPVCTAPHQVTFTPDERWLLLVCEGDRQGPGSLVVLETSPEVRYHHHVPVGRYADYVGVLGGTTR